MREHGDHYSGPERRLDGNGPEEVLPVRLTHKYAQAIDGVDLSERHVGDRLPLTPVKARLLIAEGWAEPARARQRGDDE